MNYLIGLRPTGKHFRVNVRDNNRGVKGQNIKRLAQVYGFKTLSNFCVLLGIYKTWTGSDRIGLTKPGLDRIGLTKPGSDCVRLTKPGPDPKKKRIAINFRQNSHETSNDQALA